MEHHAAGRCFCVDCADAYPEIRNTVTLSVKTCDQLLQIVKARLHADETYARALSKIATMPLGIFPGSLKDCLTQLQADTKHKSAQHFHLVENITNDIYKPILELRDQLMLKEKEVTLQYQKMQQEIKYLEDMYQKRFSAYEKSIREAAGALENWKSLERQQTPPQADPLMDERTRGSPEPSNPGQAAPINTFINFASSLSPTITSLASKTKGKDILQWVTSSSNPSVIIPPRFQDPLELRHIALSTLKKADKQRLLARKAWIEYVITCQRYSLKVQVLITKLQALIESFVLVLQDQMRKMIVFESSSLANQQYDLQMLFKAMERVDVRGDLLGLIHTHLSRRPFENDSWCDQLFQGSDLCHVTALPLPPSNVKLTPELTDKPSCLDRSIARSISTIVLLKPPPEQPQCSGDLFQSLNSLGVYDGTSDLPTQPSDEAKENEEGEWYECAEDALKKLVDLQIEMRQYWLDIIEEFNFDVDCSKEENGAQPSLSSPHSPGVVRDNKPDSDDESSPQVDLRNHLVDSPSPLIFSLAQADSVEARENHETMKIMNSWGLLDVVQSIEPPDVNLHTQDVLRTSNCRIDNDCERVFSDSHISLL